MKKIHVNESSENYLLAFLYTADAIAFYFNIRALIFLLTGLIIIALIASLLFIDNTSAAKDEVNAEAVKLSRQLNRLGMVLFALSLFISGLH